MTFNTSHLPRILSLLIFITLLQLAFCSSYNCQHDKLDHSIEIAHEQVSKHIGRRLQDSDYSNIQIYADFSLLQTDMDETLRDYVQNDLIASAILYYQQTLKVIPRGKNLTTTKQTICGISTPSVFQNGGVAADIGFIIDAGTDDSEYIAYARACVLSGSNNRPLFGNVHLNLKYLNIGTAMDLQQNLIVALHEMAHVFGISSGLFQYYYNPDTGSTRTGHIKQKTVNNVSTVVIDVEPLTSKLKAFYGCSLIDGVLMENQGGAESTNSHLERRIFFHEIMTASEIEGARLSDFMLAFLEGTGWYKGNYNMTEPLYWGKEKGCDFYYGSCMKTSNSNPPTPNFEEFCSNITATGCSADRRYAAICGGPSQAKENLTIPSFNYWGDGTVVADIFADNCPYFETNSDIDCENPLFQGSAFLKTEVYGQGSKCFTGSLGSTSTTKRTYCLKASCEQQKDSSFVMKINLGNTVATCKDSGPLFVDGYDGELDCPDPNEYCSTFGSSFCGRGCMGRGQCLNNTCQCNLGWGGNDCSTRVYVDKCERCSGNILETACYGDSCSEVPVTPTFSDDNSYDNTQNTVTVGNVNNANNAKNLGVIKAMLVFGLIALIFF